MKSESTLNQFEAWELEAYAEGVDLPHVAAFVQANPQQWVDWLQQQQPLETLFSSLRRFDCPSPDSLRLYYWQGLSPSAHSRIATHLAQCPSCTEELQTLTHSLLEPAIATEAVAQPSRSLHLPTLQLPALQLRQRIDGFAEQIRTIVASLVPPPMPQLAGVALRSGNPLPSLNVDRPTVLLFEAEETDISLLALRETNGEIVLSGQVLTEEKVAESKVKMTASDPTLPPILAQLDEAGAFIVNHLQPGVYQLTIALPNRTLVIPDVIFE